MSQLADQVLFNIAIATVLACLAYPSRYFGRPALTHILWLIVLARLLVPPIWSVPRLEWSSAKASTSALPLVVDEPLYDDESSVPTGEFPPQALSVVEPTPMPVAISSAEIPWELLAVSAWAAI